MVKNLSATAGDVRDAGSISGLGRCHVCRRTWQPTPVFWLGESPGQRSLVGCSPWGHKEPDTTEAIEHTVHFSRWGSWLPATVQSWTPLWKYSQGGGLYPMTSWHRVQKSRITPRSHEAQPLGLGEASLWFIFFLYPILLLSFPYKCCSWDFFPKHRALQSLLKV